MLPTKVVTLQLNWGCDEVFEEKSKIKKNKNKKNKNKTNKKNRK